MLRSALSTAAAGAAGGGYQISRSLRFNSADSAYLSRTPASAGNQRKFTFSTWAKFNYEPTSSAEWYTIIGVGDYASATPSFKIDITGGIRVAFFTSSGYTGYYFSSMRFRDFSAWYHIVLAVDTEQATAEDRVKMYVNGNQIIFGSVSNIAQNYDTGVNTTQVHRIGAFGTSTGLGSYGRQYLADIHFIDGQALTPSSFGETDATTGVWKPKAYAGTYGTNGFHLDFSDNSSTTALGYDAAGSNDWTVNNFSVTAGAGNDSLVDSPTQYGDDTGAGGEVRGNYATLNVLASPQLAGQYVISNGNLDITPTGASSTYNSYAPATIALPSSGKYYFEYTCTNPDAGQRRDTIGLAQTTASGIWLGNTGSIGYDAYEGKVNNNGSNIATYASWDNGDVVSVAVDCDTGYVWFGKNGTWQAGNPSAGTGATATLSNISTYAFAVGTRAASSAGYTVKGSVNFGQRAFSQTPPSGFKALCTTNLPDPTVLQGDDYFNTVLYTGNGGTQTVSGVGFQPDLTWVKDRSTGNSHWLNDAVRGAGSSLASNTNEEEKSYAAYFTAFNSDGFALAGGTGGFNATSDAYVAWNWKANGAGGTSHTQGTISSTASVNTTAGFSIVTYTGTGAVGTVGHGLGVKPAFILTKSRSTTEGWGGYHKSLGASYGIFLELTDAAYPASNYWNNTEPTSTVFTVNVNRTNNGTMVAYCFAEVEGFSKFGSYTGNGSADGPFVYTGFRPAWVMVKGSSFVSNWNLFDVARNPYNLTTQIIRPNSSAVEFDGNTNTGGAIDITSNGFKIRKSDADVNTNSATFIYAAFAENPFKNSLAR